MTNPSGKWKIIQSKVAFSNKYITIREDRIINTNGQEMDYYTMASEPLVAILAINSNNEMLITNQFRVSIRQNISGLPGGRIEETESVIEAGRREMIEETGYDAKSIKLLSKIYLDPGRSEKLISIVLAKDLIKKDSQNDGEIERLDWINLENAVEMVTKGEIQDPVAQYAILFYFVKKIKSPTT